MKRKLIVPILVCSMFIATGCTTSKDAITTNAFKDEAKKVNLTIEDAIDDVSSDFNFKEATIAYDENDGYQLEFYVTDSNLDANHFIDSARASIEDTYSSGSKTSVEVGNYEKFTYSYKDEYYFIERVDDTVFYGYTESGNKTAINNFAEKIGY